jgi:ATP-binding cassette subfamily F protein 3
MVIISASGVTKSFGIKEVIKDISFNVNAGDKIGIIGINGAGKTTLFNMIAGEQKPDAGQLHIAAKKTIGYMKQHAAYTSSKTAEEEVLSVFDSLIEQEKALNELVKKLKTDDSLSLIEKYHVYQQRFIDGGGLTFRARAHSTLIGLGLTEEETKLALLSISGGQRTRVLLAKILLGGAEVLLLDEPTNHLDMKAILFVEEFLSSYKGTVLIISHDRFFLDKVTNKTFILEQKALSVYEGNYTKAIEKREQQLKAKKRAFDKNTKEIKRLEGIIEQQKRWNRQKNLVTARSKQKVVDRIQSKTEAPGKEPEKIKFAFRAMHGAGKDILIIKDVKKSFSKEALFEGASLHIRNGQRVFILGDNGTGKTTLLKIITGEQQPDEGEVMLGARVKAGYFSQAESDMMPDKRVIDLLTDDLPHLDTLHIRNALAAFLFKADDVYKDISTLSGGERARVALSRLMLSKCNFLIMDEPTNHLDIESKEALEQALLSYDGTLLMVSHDRYFINKLADKIYAIEDGRINEYIGGYDDYISHRPEQKTNVTPAEKKPNEYTVKKEKEKEIRRAKGRIGRLEQAVEELEGKIAGLQQELLKEEVSSDYEKIVEISNKIEDLQTKLDQKMKEWEECGLLLT